MTDERPPLSSEPDDGPSEPRTAERSPIADFFGRHRKRLLRVAFLAFAVVVLLDLSQTMPAETTVELAIGPAHREAVLLDVDVTDAAGDGVRSVRLAFPDGAPATVTETLDLAPGTYGIDVRAQRADGSTFALEGRLVTPAEGTVHVALDRVR